MGPLPSSCPSGKVIAPITGRRDLIQATAEHSAFLFPGEIKFDEQMIVIKLHCEVFPYCVA